MWEQASIKHRKVDKNKASGTTIFYVALTSIDEDGASDGYFELFPECASDKYEDVRLNFRDSSPDDRHKGTNLLHKW